MQFIDNLPGNAQSTVFPFASLVININICTKAHRDKKDQTICLVVPIGEFEGGDLVLYEQGLVLDLRSGDIAVFCSAETTHFNLQYTGQRASFVLQTDSEFDKWLVQRNGWRDNIHFQ